MYQPIGELLSNVTMLKLLAYNAYLLFWYIMLIIIIVITLSVLVRHTNKDD